MKKAIVLAFLVITSGTITALDFNPFEGPRPIAVLIQTDPWLMVIGSDTPLIALYEDGQVIYFNRKENTTVRYLHKQLNADEIERVKRELSSFGDYEDTKPHYDLAPAVTDLPETRLYLSFDNTKLVTSVYGLKISDTKLPAVGIFGNDTKPDSLPDNIKNLHAYLTSLDFDGAEPWEPAWVEVMIWSYDYAPEESIRWPDDWPGLDSPYTVKRGDSYSIFLPGQEIPRLREFLKTRRSKGAIEIDGQKWAASARYTFPGEPTWNRAFRGKN